MVQVASSIDGFEDVLAAASTGQEWAVACLYDELQPALLRYLRWQEPTAAEDLAAETWLAVAERLPRFEGDEGAFRAWIFAIARRRLADHRRRAVRRRTVPVPDEMMVMVPAETDVGQQVADAMAAQQVIRRLTGVLPPDQAEIVMLRVIGGLSVEETARAVSKRPGTVRVLQHRALRRLADDLRRQSVVEV